MPEIRMMQKTIQRELEFMVGRVQTSHTRLAIKRRIEALLTSNGNDINHIDVYVGASKVDPTMVVITPMNVLTGMLMMGYHYPYYDVPKLLGKRYEDENGVWESFTDLNDDPCFTFTPSGPCKTFSGYLYVDPSISHDVVLAVSPFLRSISRLTDEDSDALEVSGIPVELYDELRALYPPGLMGSDVKGDQCI